MSRRSANQPRARHRERRNGVHADHAKASNGAVAATNRANPEFNFFTRIAQTAARWSGKPAAFLIALTLIVVWALCGPLFGYSDTWQLVVNTATTIITFLMVFLIQNTQNRDTMALQIKLADLIIAMRGAHNQLAAAEDMSDDDLEALHEEYRARAEAILASLKRRRTAPDAGPAN
jgi:low affinity Fe/Cu permease